ncbi:MAG: quinone-dependent dihydroorotate dehydrogenase [Chloroflexi bacterium]|nr:quinone-dependent dihydroorotate dehydrogenase [Chloroflexota bacterium]
MASTWDTALYRRVLFPLLKRLDAESAHHLAVVGLNLASALAPTLARPGGRSVELWGLQFPNRIGLAAGFDKNATAVRALAALGFGHVEVGTVTPLPQPGRTKPRVFRLEQDDGLINRLGFPSDGMEAVARRLERLRQREYVLGVNVGPNADSVGVDGFVRAAERLAPLADYLTVNVSSPNTSGLRGLQAAGVLGELLGAVRRVTGKPLLIKIAPDMSESELASVVRTALEHKADGLIATNTTVERPATLRSANAGESGGLSGLPLRDRATEVVRLLARESHGNLPIIAAGGVASESDVRAKLDAGASLVQLYTGFIFHGPGLPRRLSRVA